VSTDLDRLATQLTGVLEQIKVLQGAATPLALDPGGFPNAVAAGELIESQWGNAVRSHLRVFGNTARTASDFTWNGSSDAIVIANVGVGIPLQSFPQVLLISTSVSVGNDGAAAAFTLKHQRQATGVIDSATATGQTIGASMWTSMSLNVSIGIAANASPVFHILVGGSNPSGTNYARLTCSYSLYPA
jgi:hypothetical protein